MRSITVNGQPARSSRAVGELRVAPANGLPAGSTFTTVVRYDGVPRTLPDGSGFIHTDDGALVIGKPDQWAPRNRTRNPRIKVLPMKVEPRASRTEFWYLTCGFAVDGS